MKRASAALVFSALALATSAALGQTAPNQTTTSTGNNQNKPPETLKTIVVTGSAIPRTDYETSSPVRVITDEQIKASGLTNIADVVRSISADNSGTIPNAFSLGFAAGASGVALRGMTVNSTLVLIDGHRVADYAVSDDGQRSFVDLNTIPLQAVDRIEVLKDGASSIYGADAIAGVVNIILKPTYQGAEVTAELGDSQHGGGFEKRVTGMFGSGDLESQGHNAYLDFTYEKDNAIRTSQRGFPFNTPDLSSMGNANLIGGQPQLNSGSIYGSVAPATLGTPGNLLTGVQVPGSLYQPLRACGPLGTETTTAGVGTYCTQNFQSDYTDVQPSLLIDGLHGRFTFKLNDTTTAYLDAYYMESKLRADGTMGPAQIQAGTPNNTNTIALPPVLTDGQPNPNNPFAAQGQYALINYAFGDIPGYSQYHNHSLRLEGNVSGSLGNWNYAASLIINHTWLNTENVGLIDFQQLMADVADGSYSFVNPASNSPAVLAALSPGANKTSTSDLDALDFTMNRDFGQLEGGQVGVAWGVQVRHEAQNDPDLNPDLKYQGLGVAHTIGSRNVSALFGEVDAPLLKSLEVDVSARYDHYSDFGGAFDPKLGIKWTPLPQFALRGTVSRGFRAPSFSESANSSAEGFTSFGIDPASELYAEHHGDAYVSQNYALAQFATANPNVKPERSTSYTFGAIFQPTDWLNGTLDYYAIKKTGVIVQSDPTVALNAYLDNQPLPAGYALTLDTPDPLYPTARPRPIVVEAPYVNANQENTDGIDLNLRAHFPIGRAQFVSDFNATKILSWAMEFPDGSHQQYVGTQGPYILSSGAGTPRYRASWSNTLTYGPWTGTATIYYVSGLYMSAPDLTGPGCFASIDGFPNPSNCRVPSFTHVDLTGSWQITHDVSINGAILNVFDRDPPFDPIDYAGLNYNPTYAQAGIVGRFYKLGVDVKFR